MTDRPPVTQRDVAQACSVHPSTICLALKNSPSIPLETRQRVQAVAAELGYTPNVGARNLALLRGNRQNGGSLPIAWMNQEPQRNHWRTDEEARAYFDHARRRATELGYHLEEIWAREPGMTTARLVRIIQTRGIEGIIFPVHRSFDFSLLSPVWNDFALVALNDHRAAEWIDLVCPDHYRNADTVFRQIRRLGFRRVGLALASQFDAATSGLVHGCFLRYQSDVTAGERIPVCFHTERPDTKHTEFEQWFNDHRPDVVVSADAELVRRARSLGFRALWVGLGGTAFPFDAGIDDGASELAGAAVDCVVDKIRRFEKGVRESTRMHLMKSAWIEPRFQQLETEPVVA